MFSKFANRMSVRLSVSARVFTAALLLVAAALWLPVRLPANSSVCRAAEPEQTNLLVNGSFDNGPAGLGLTSLPGWSVTRGTVDVGSNPDPRAADGQQSLDLIGTPGAGTIRQSFATESGRRYVFAGWVAHHPGVFEAGANLSVNNQPLEALYHSGQVTGANPQWARFTREFTANATTTTLVIEDRNLAGYDYGGTFLDGLSVTASAATTGPAVLDQRTALTVSTTSCDPPQSKTVFAPNDARVFHWTLLNGIRSGDTLRWEFIQPNGSVFFTSEDRFNFSGGGCAWEGIPIAGNPAASLPGNWQVRVSYNGAALLTGAFSIQGNGGPAPSTGAAVIIDGTDANEHGDDNNGSGNDNGWVYMQKALENLAAKVPAGSAKVVVSLGTESGKTARRAIDSAYRFSTLPGAGWSLRHVDGAASISAWLTTLSANTTGLLYIPTYHLASGDLEASELAAINAQASRIADFINRGSGSGGALFAMGENDNATEKGAWGWLRALFPGLEVTQIPGSGGVGTNISLTPDGTAAFPGLSNSDMASADPWHNYFTGDLGTLKVLATAQQSGVTRNIVIGGVGIVVPSPVCPTVSGFSPTRGQPSTPVVITGNNLTGVTAVKFANGVVANFTPNSNTQLTAIVPSGAVNGPITVSKAGCPDAATSASFTIETGGGGRIVRVGCGSARPGGTLTLPLELVAQGDENALGFSLVFDPGVLGNPQVARGGDASAAILNTNTSQLGAGRIGIALALPSGQTFAAGTRQFALVTFSVAGNTAVTQTYVEFGDAPIRRQAASANAQSLNAEFQGCANIRIEVATGYEADVTPRPNGRNDGTIAITDWVQVGRFAAGLDTAATGGEFQRADCAPRDSKGDGQMGIVDWVQAGRYAAGLDAPQTAGGPSNPTGFAFARVADASFAHARAVRVVNATLQRGQTGALAVEIEAEGEENAFGFSLEFDSTVLSFVSATVGGTLGNALLNVNAGQAAGGRVGFALALPAGETLRAGKQTLLSVRFTALTSSSAASTAVRFGDQPIRRQLADANAATLAASYEDGTASFGNAVASVSAASFRAEAAPEAILAAFGTGLANSVAAATQLPLPTALAGTSVRVKDSAGTERLAPLFFVAPTQLNYLLPAGTAPGAATLTITNAAGATASGTLNVTAVAPSLFTANANGQGVAAALLLRIRANGAQSFEPVARYDAAQGRFVATPLGAGEASEQLYLLLFGSGLRNYGNLAAATAAIGGLAGEVQFIGAVNGLAGLDQINLRLPRGLAGRGVVDVLLSVDGRTANPVQVAFQ